MTKQKSLLLDLNNVQNLPETDIERHDDHNREHVGSLSNLHSPVFRILVDTVNEIYRIADDP